MSDPPTILLAIIALSCLLMALIQVGVVIFAARLARRVERVRAQVQEDLQPVLAKLEAVGSNAVEASRLAVAQVQRADKAFSDLAVRAEGTMTSLQSAVTAPARQWRAVRTGIRAGAAAFFEMRRQGRGRRGRMDEEDPLFIG